jgi:acyl-CoA thioesterase
LTQDGAVMATSLAAFSTPWTGLDFDLAPPPDIGSPDDCFKLPTGGLTPRFVENFDMRWGIGDLPYSGSSKATVGGYLRFDEPQTVDAPAVACLLDAWAPTILPRATKPVVAPTIDITMHFRVPFPVDGAAPDDFFLFRLDSTLGRDGFFEEDGDLWTASGTLVAQCRQLAIALPIG